MYKKINSLYNVNEKLYHMARGKLMELKTILSGLENLKVKGSVDVDVPNIKNCKTRRYVCCNKRI